jgi:hypothetical protein
MRFAAQSWVHTHAWSGDYEIAGIEVTGSNFAITGFIESLI